MGPRLSCRCGATFRSYGAEARHRHNFPMLCRKAKVKKGEGHVPAPIPVTYGRSPAERERDRLDLEWRLDTLRHGR